MTTANKVLTVLGIMDFSFSLPVHGAADVTIRTLYVCTQFKARHRASYPHSSVNNAGTSSVILNHPNINSEEKIRCFCSVWTLNHLYENIDTRTGARETSAGDLRYTIGQAQVASMQACRFQTVANQIHQQQQLTYWASAAKLWGFEVVVRNCSIQNFLPNWYRQYSHTKRA